ncbi:MAG: sel1 repeat family protein, partial [Clostridia bacterium]|nr:sel1 repeat family protein [Clostridia bacterium]
EWYQKSANKGLAVAQNNLGNCYYWGYGVTRDYRKAVEWYKKAAAQGYSRSIENLKVPALKNYV